MQLTSGPISTRYGQVKDGLGSALSAVIGGADAQKTLDDLAKELQASSMRTGRKG